VYAYVDAYAYAREHRPAPPCFAAGYAGLHLTEHEVLTSFPDGGLV
jgi:hypothetical protein